MNRDDELAGLWLKEDRNGRKYMSGKLTLDGQTVPIVVFKNTFKQPGENSPDYRIYRQQPRDGQAQEQQPQRARGEPQGGYRPPPKPSETAKAGAVAAQAPADADLDDEIPF